jgi:protease I
MSQSIAVLVTDEFEDSEYWKPVDALRAAGYAIFNIEKAKDNVVKGKKDQSPVTIDLAIEDAKVDDYAGLLIPGGHSPDGLRGDDRFAQFVKDFDATGKPIFTICHGPHLLISAEVVKGRKMTSVKNIAIDLKNAGALFEDSAVVIDSNRLVTSRTPEDLGVFNDAMLKVLAEHKG